jgi:hypothetical protein
VDGGEVWMLNSANYNSGPVNVTKSVSILAIPGAVGSVVALGGPAFNIATAGVNVSLRNLVIMPFPAAGGTSGIAMTNGDSLTIQKTLIANLESKGIDVDAIPGTRLKVMDSVIRDNADYGVHLRGGAVADISNSKITGNFYGVFVDASGDPAIPLTTSAAVNDSVLSANDTGLHGYAPTANSTARWSAIRTTASNNGTGFVCLTFSAGGVASCTVGDSMAQGNSLFGFEQFGPTSTFRSLGNNIVIDNDTNVSGTITPLAGT